MRGSDFMSIVPPVAALTQKERWPVCVHEAGHALVGLALSIGDVEAIVVARQAGHRDDSIIGHVEWRRPVVRNRTLRAYRDEIAMLLGGKAAEKAVLDEMYVGSGGVEGSDLHGQRTLQRSSLWGEVDLIAKPPFRADTHTIADDQHPHHQLRVNRRTTCAAVERLQL